VVLGVRDHRKSKRISLKNSDDGAKMMGYGRKCLLLIFKPVKLFAFQDQFLRAQKYFVRRLGLREQLDEFFRRPLAVTDTQQ